MRGKDTGDIYTRQFIEDHPRLCGEKQIHTPTEPQHLGSPPPMRGKAGEQTPETMYQRITPAYAGKRSLSLEVVIVR